METIVVGFDGSPKSRPVIEWAVREAVLRGGRLHIVHAYPLAAAEYDFVPADEFKAIAERVAGEALEFARAAVAPDENLDISVETVNSLPAPALLDAVIDADASLLVIGTRGHGAFVGMLTGSVGQRCASKAPCPVVVFRSSPAEPATA